MNNEKLNNVIILKGIPSNLIEEAILILKPTDIQSKKKVEEYARLEGTDFVKEYLQSEEKKKKTSKREDKVLFQLKRKKHTWENVKRRANKLKRFLQKPI